MSKSAVVTLVVLAAACSSTSAHRPPASIGSPTTLTAFAPDPCALVTKADVMVALPGLDIVEGQPGRQPQGGDCLYLVNQTSRAVDVKVFRPKGATRYDALRRSQPDTKDLSGLGDRAFAQRSGSTISVLKGDTLVEVVAENDDSELFRAAVHRLAGVAVSRLPAA
jgi:hypothetical protein